MKYYPRYLTPTIVSDLKKKMVFVGGPRQVGKTTLAKSLLGSNPKGYLNWDVAAHRERILKQELPVSEFWIFDEIHKYRSWRNFLKGLYDADTKQKILVTGSARLDYYRRGGDSLQGRYFYLRLHPLSVAELKISSPRDFERLLTFGGFPEPYFGQNEIDAKRWSRDYRTRLLQEDLMPLERIQDIGHLELLTLRLPELVGSPLSINALREDLQVSHKTLSKWLDILERLYAIFRLSPFGAPKLRAVKKEQKHYHFDWSLVPKKSYQFENLVAGHLLKWVHFKQDTEGSDVDLRYFRDVDKREVDFIVTKKNKPVQAIECKWDDDPVGDGLKYFKNKFPGCECWQISAIGKKDYCTKEKIRGCPAILFLKNLV